jgi:hypothetical protein
MNESQFLVNALKLVDLPLITECDGCVDIVFLHFMKIKLVEWSAPYRYLY